MHVQKKFAISDLKHERLLTLLPEKGAVLKRRTVTRDTIFLPDDRAHVDSFIEKYSLSPSTKGLFLRLREENDLKALNLSSQVLDLQAYRIENDLLIDDHIHLGLDYTKHGLAELLHFLQLLGMDKVVEVTKKRDEYEIAALGLPVILTLDHIEGLAEPFIEMHASIEKKELPEIEAAFLALSRLLLLVADSCTSTTYYQMILRLASG